MELVDALDARRSGSRARLFRSPRVRRFRSDARLPRRWKPRTNRGSSIQLLEAREHQGARGRHSEAAGLRAGEPKGHRPHEPRKCGCDTLAGSRTCWRRRGTGVIVGTAVYIKRPAYRSEEWRSTNGPTSGRSDVCVLYEMLTAQRAFPGETISDTIAAVLDREPDVRALPADTPTSPVKICCGGASTKI